MSSTAGRLLVESSGGYGIADMCVRYIHEGEFAINPKSLNARAAKLRRFIRDQPHKEAVLVSHG